MTKARILTSLLLGGALAATGWAQNATKPDTSSPDRERELKKAEAQMRDAERRMRDAEMKLKEAARQMAKLHSGDLGRHIAKQVERVVVLGDRPAIGVILNTDSNAETDKLGAAVEGLTPGGPAEEAGLKAGDIIVSINGKRLTEGPVDADEDESAPAARLRAYVHDNVKDGDKVTLEVKRGGESKTFTVSAQAPYGPRVRKFEFHAPEDIEIDIPDISLPSLDFFGPRQWRDLELVELNPDLGDYFGAKGGVLVVRAPEDSPLKLKGGDIILKIGDRTPTSPTQALRILRSYEPGETATIEVLRKKAKVTIPVQMPAHKAEESYHYRMSPGTPRAPRAPMPPDAPVAPTEMAPPTPPKPAPSTL
jgi:C-terminal processing protease CtpA/Prc